MRLWRLGSVGQMITGTLESLQLTQGFKHEPSVPVINTKAYRECTHLNIEAAPYATQTHVIRSLTIVAQDEILFRLYMYLIRSTDRPASVIENESSSSNEGQESSRKIVSAHYITPIHL